MKHPGNVFQHVMDPWSRCCVVYLSPITLIPQVNKGERIKKPGKRTKDGTDLEGEVTPVTVDKRKDRGRKTTSKLGAVKKKKAVGP